MLEFGTTHLATKISQAETPEDILAVYLSMGFVGLLFHRWYPETMDLWEAMKPGGFVEKYHGSGIYKHCPAAKAIHSSTRSYTFSEVRAAHKQNIYTERAESLFRSFGVMDGIVVLTGHNEQKAAVALMSPHLIDLTSYPDFDLLDYAAAKLTKLLPKDHHLLTNSKRELPALSEMQRKILQLQIEEPEMGPSELADNLSISLKTLQSHHKKIAKKVGVSSFTGAVVKQLKTT